MDLSILIIKAKKQFTGLLSRLQENKVCVSLLFLF